MRIKPKINRLDIEKPYNAGTFAGIIIGIGVSKILIEVFQNNNNGIVTGFMIMIVGIIIWYYNFN